ncbi:TPA: hypothetical protein ACF2DD_002149 [Clostridium perfringens]|uniref:hypothetical protein n=1 Tax=Clostridium perfringens TaxID=1502 RepID=UPI002910B69D|nr:hypothetical protein [Clostridium perfringens]MDU4051193.1 hypothetical protein [Clostridium perfringens]
MNIGQLTSMINCNGCHMPLAIFPHETEIICKLCGTKNNLVTKLNIDNDIKLNMKPIHKLKLNTDKIKTIDDVKRILEFIGIEVEVKENITNEKFEKVKDLFE